VDLVADFGQPATVRRGADVAVAVTIVLDKETRAAGEFGETTAVVPLVRFRTAEWRPKSGDIVSVAGGDRRVDRIDAEDGYVTTAVLYG
jgi:hypothetical protein